MKINPFALPAEIHQIEAATKPRRVQSADTLLVRSIIAVDAGNRTLQWIDPDGAVVSIPSVIKPIDPELQDVRNPGSRSVVIELPSGETYAVGQLAKDLKGTQAFKDDKIALAQKLVLAALQPNPGSDAVRIERLILAVPDSRHESVKALKALEQTHEFRRNGQDVIASIRKVEVIDETVAAYRFAMKTGLFTSRLNPNAVLDLGGGTSILRLFSADGVLLRGDDVILPGTFVLAQSIAAKLAKRMTYSPDLTTIMDGIEQAAYTGSYQLGTTGIEFSAEFEASRTEWLDEIRGEIKTRWAARLAELGEVLLIGGSAPLAAPLEAMTKGRFKIAPQPQTISITAMTEL